MENFQQILPITKVKRNLLDIINSMEEDENTIAITRNGEPVGVMMTMERYETLLETIEILGDKAAMRALEGSKKDFESGRTFDDREVWED
jgi:prevent-host-death family protein